MEQGPDIASHGNLWIFSLPGETSSVDAEQNQALTFDKLNLLLLLGFQVIASQEITAQITGLICRSTVAVQLIAAVAQQTFIELDLDSQNPAYSCFLVQTFSVIIGFWIREAVDLIYLQQYPSNALLWGQIRTTMTTFHMVGGGLM